MSTSSLVLERSHPSVRNTAANYSDTDGSPVSGFHDWSRIQRINLSRHANGLAPFHPREFGNGPASPARAHINAVNELVLSLRQRLQRNLTELQIVSNLSEHDPKTITHFTVLKDRGQRWIEVSERVWDFYLQLFGQRNSRVSGRLLASDRIALDCYQAVYMGLGKARSIPSPPPFSFVSSVSGPATYRRGIDVPQLGHIANPFPLIQLPHNRLLNPWTLGAIPHEALHNIVKDLGLSDALPQEMVIQLRTAGLPPETVNAWKAWHSELFSDLAGVLLIGPAMVASLIGVLARESDRVVRYDPGDPHPPGLLRVPIAVNLVERLGFRRQAQVFTKLWHRLYPKHLARSLPHMLLADFKTASDVAIGALIFTKYDQLGHKRFVDVVPYGKKEQAITHESAGRLAAGVDPGIVPERFLIGAARSALERRLAPPSQIATNFYAALERK